VALRHDIRNDSVFFAHQKEFAQNRLIYMEDGHDGYAATAIRPKRLPHQTGTPG
jgi:hypothetical protein